MSNEDNGRGPKWFDIMYATIGVLSIITLIIIIVTLLLGNLH